jgi:hypothetical protein
MLLRGEELSTKSGIGGVIARLGGDGLLDLDCRLAARSRVKLLAWWREGGPTAVWLRLLFDLIRLNDRGGHAIAWFEYGLAIMLVPGVAAGGGRPDGLSDLNSG